MFGPKTQQKKLYEAVSPLINEVVQGYNCTIFAYGTTGSGKTYTMKGQKIAKVSLSTMEVAKIHTMYTERVYTIPFNNSSSPAPGTFAGRRIT